MKKAIGILLMVAGVAVGLYLGVWWAFIGGIVQAVHGVQGANAMDIAIGIAKFCFAGLIGWLSFFGVAGFGAVLASA